jgi:hypothetical protein
MLGGAKLQQVVQIIRGFDDWDERNSTLHDLGRFVFENRRYIWYIEYCSSTIEEPGPMDAEWRELTIFRARG